MLQSFCSSGLIQILAPPTTTISTMSDFASTLRRILRSIALVRVRGEFQENPDLQGSVEGLGRLVDADAGTVRMVLETLVRAGFLHRTAEAFYVATRA